MKKVLTILLTLALVMGLTIGSAGAVTPAPNWDISGTWVLDFAGGTANREFRDVVQDEFGNVTGEFWWFTSGAWEYGGTLVGTVSGNDLYLYYDRAPAYVYEAEFVGTISKEGIQGTFQGLVGTSFYCDWSASGTLRLLYEARIAGGGQILAESMSELDKKGNPQEYKISFGMGVFIVNGAYWLDGLDVTFHNVSNNDVDKGKFVADEITNILYFSEGTVTRFYVNGTFNDEPGYNMIIRAEDAGEPGSPVDTGEPGFYADNIRFELFNGSTPVYDSDGLTIGNQDFTRDSNNTGTHRTFLDKGNLQIEDLR